MTWMTAASQILVATVARYLREVGIELSLALQHANELEALNFGLAEIALFESCRLRLVRDSIQSPGMFARASTRRAHASEMERLESERQVLAATARRAKEAMTEVEKIRSDATSYVHQKICREQPGLVEAVSAWLGNADILEEARRFNCARAATFATGEPSAQN